MFLGGEKQSSQCEKKKQMNNTDKGGVTWFISNLGSCFDQRLTLEETFLGHIRHLREAMQHYIDLLKLCHMCYRLLMNLPVK